MKPFVLFIISCFLTSLGFAHSVDDAAYCSATADALNRACLSDIADEHWTTYAKCINIADSAERANCNNTAKSDAAEARQLCQEQFDGRKDACKALGEDRYDPDINPAAFESDFKNLGTTNPYFPLRIGDRWEYQSETEVDTVEVLNRTKLIDGVTCIVLRDIVKTEGHVEETTNDWYAQARDGNTWYFGEETATYETYEGDRPMLAEMVSIDGSFKAGRDNDKGGIIFLAKPKPGVYYLEEFSLNNAEDVTRVLSTSYSYGSNPELDRNVPRQLAELLCSGDCVVTKNYSLLEPGAFARKYYAPEIGVFLEVESTGEVVQLTRCNFDSRCSKLPAR